MIMALSLAVNTSIHALSIAATENNTPGITNEIEKDEDVNLFNWVQEINENYKIIDNLKNIARTIAVHNSVKKAEDSLWHFLNVPYDCDLLRKMDNPKIFRDKQKEQAEKSITKMAELIETGKLEELLLLLSRAGFKAEIYNDELHEYQEITVPRDISKDQLNFLNNRRLIDSLVSFLKEKENEESSIRKYDNEQSDDYKEWNEDLYRLSGIRKSLSKVKTLVNNDQFVKTYREVESLYLNFGRPDTRTYLSDILRGDFGYGVRAAEAWKQDMLLFLDTSNKKYEPEINELLDIFLIGNSTGFQY